MERVLETLLEWTRASFESALGVAFPEIEVYIWKRSQEFRVKKKTRRYDHNFTCSTVVDALYMQEDSQCPSGDFIGFRGIEYELKSSPDPNCLDGTCLRPPASFVEGSLEERG